MNTVFVLSWLLGTRLFHLFLRFDNLWLEISGTKFALETLDFVVFL